MPGLDPGIHSVPAQLAKANGMDCRVKPDHDEGTGGEGACFFLLSPWGEDAASAHAAGEGAFESMI